MLKDQSHPLAMGYIVDFHVDFKLFDATVPFYVYLQYLRLARIQFCGGYPDSVTYFMENYLRLGGLWQSNFFAPNSAMYPGKNRQVFGI